MRGYVIALFPYQAIPFRRDATRTVSFEIAFTKVNLTIIIKHRRVKFRLTLTKNIKFYTNVQHFFLVTTRIIYENRATFGY